MRPWDRQCSGSVTGGERMARRAWQLLACWLQQAFMPPPCVLYRATAASRALPGEPRISNTSVAREYFLNNSSRSKNLLSQTKTNKWVNQRNTRFFNEYDKKVNMFRIFDETRRMNGKLVRYTTAFSSVILKRHCDSWTRVKFKNTDK